MLGGKIKLKSQKIRETTNNEDIIYYLTIYKKKFDFLQNVN